MMTAHRIDWLLVSMHLPGFIAPQWLSGRRRQPGLSGRSRACNCKEGDPCDSTISGSWSLGVRHRRFVTVGTPGLAGRLLRIPDGDGIAAALRRRSDRPPKATAADTDRGGPWFVTKPWSSMAAAPLSTVGRGRWSGDPCPSIRLRADGTGGPVGPPTCRQRDWCRRVRFTTALRIAASRTTPIVVPCEHPLLHKPRAKVQVSLYGCSADGSERPRMWRRSR